MARVRARCPDTDGDRVLALSNARYLMTARKELKKAVLCTKAAGEGWSRAAQSFQSPLTGSLTSTGRRRTLLGSLRGLHFSVQQPGFSTHNLIRGGREKHEVGGRNETRCVDITKENLTSFISAAACISRPSGKVGTTAEPQSEGDAGISANSCTAHHDKCNRYGGGNELGRVRGAGEGPAIDFGAALRGYRCLGYAGIISDCAVWLLSPLRATLEAICDSLSVCHQPTMPPTACRNADAHITRILTHLQTHIFFFHSEVSLDAFL